VPPRRRRPGRREIAHPLDEPPIIGAMEYAATAAFFLSVVAGSFAAVILGGYGIAQLIASAL
jgi:hypothetical protein